MRALQDDFLTAWHFAARAHLTQKMPGEDLPYLVHLGAVATEILFAHQELPFEQPKLALQCALLHDVLEDTATDEAEIVETFGPAVAAGVRSLTKDLSLPKREAMLDSLQRIRRQPTEVWAVKLADRITNLGPAPPAWGPEKIASYQRSIRRRLTHRLRAESRANPPSPDPAQMANREDLQFVLWNERTDSFVPASSYLDQLVTSTPAWQADLGVASLMLFAEGRQWMEDWILGELEPLLHQLMAARSRLGAHAMAALRSTCLDEYPGAYLLLVPEGDSILISAVGIADRPYGWLFPVDWQEPGESRDFYAYLSENHSRLQVDWGPTRVSRDFLLPAIDREVQVGRKLAEQLHAPISPTPYFEPG